MINDDIKRFILILLLVFDISSSGLLVFASQPFGAADLPLRVPYAVSLPQLFLPDTKNILVEMFTNSSSG